MLPINTLTLLPPSFVVSPNLQQGDCPELWFAMVESDPSADVQGLDSRHERCHIYNVKLDQLDEWAATYEKWDAPDAKQSDADMLMNQS